MHDFATELDDLEREGLLRARRVVTSLPDGYCELNGRRLVNFAGNDYLNLAHDPRMIAAAGEALEQAGTGSTASALVTGRSPWHASLEERLAEFFGAPAALLFPTGYAANAGTIAALVGGEDTVYCDRLNHASLIDGCRLSGARLRIYRHDDLDRLARDLSRAPPDGHRLIVTDSLFSMDGDCAPLGELCDLAESHEAMLLVDEAHAFGCCGAAGRGLAELAGVEARVAVRIGTLSKAAASLGGFVVGSRSLIDWLWNRARPHMFSTALPASACAAAIRALDLMRDEPWRRSQLQARAAELRAGLAPLGVPAAEIPGPIVPVMLGNSQDTVAAAGRLEEAGFVVAAIRPPTVPRGTSRLRITVTAAHTAEQVAHLVRELNRVHAP